jgi:hypothetical protein
MPYLAANPNDDVPQFARDFVREVAAEFIFSDTDPLYPGIASKKRVSSVLIKIFFLDILLQ